MELTKTEYSQTKGNGKLDKVLIKCDKPNYYELVEFLNIAHNKQAIIIKTLYDNQINLVLKFGILTSIEKEYTTSNELLELPNFIQYFCMFECNDDIKNIINNENTISNYSICHYGENPIGILVMKYYYLGCIDNYHWSENNFDVLKNILKQVIFSVIYAYDVKGFIHGDLHSGNVLLKPKKHEQINYGNRALSIDSMEAIIMDFEKSKLNQKNKISDLIRGIDKLFTSVINSNNMELDLDYDRNKLVFLKSMLDTNSFYNTIGEIIDEMTIYP